MKTYSDILSWMYKKLPVFQKTGSSAYKPGLDRIKKLLISLKNPEKNFKSILFCLPPNLVGVYRFNIHT